MSFTPVHTDIHCTPACVAVSSSSVAAAVGGAVGSVVLLAGVGVLVFVLLRRRGFFAQNVFLRGGTKGDLFVDPLRCSTSSQKENVDER